MSLSPLSTTGNQLKLSLYLPSIGYGLLLVEAGSTAPRLPFLPDSSNAYFWGLAVTLLGAVLIHEFIEAYSGPDTGLLEPVPEGRTYQSIAFTIFAAGAPTDYPESLNTPFWAYDVDIPKRRYFVAGLLFVTAAILVISFPYTIMKLGQFALERSSVLLGAVAFAQTVFLLRLSLNGVWPKTHLFWEDYLGSGEGQ